VTQLTFKMQAQQQNGNKNNTNSAGNDGNGDHQQGNGGAVDQSHQQQIREMQRFQQQVQAAQYRQQQHYAGSTAVGGASAVHQMSLMQQQQGSVPGMGNSAALANMMQHGNNSGMGHSTMSQHQNQQQQAMGMPFNSVMSNSNNVNNNMGGMQQPIGVVYGNVPNNSFSNWTNPLQSQQQNYNGSDPFSMDSSGGSSARLMAMSGMGGNQSFGASTAASGMQGGGVGQQLSHGDAMTNTALSNAASSSTALQNMQALLIKQQQANLVNRQSMQQQQQQQQHVRPMVLPGIPTALNSSQQFPLTASTTANSVGNQQQLLLFQQQLAALQKQQQMNGGGGGSVATNAAMVAMQQLANGNSMHPQQLQNSLGLNSQTDTSSTIHQQGTPQQNLMQARQQHLVQHMQQQQANRSTSDNSNTEGSAATSANRNQGHRARNSGNHSMLQQMTNANPGMLQMMQQQNSGVAQGGQHAALQNGGNDNTMTMMNSNYQQQGFMGNQNNLTLSNRDYPSSSGQDHFVEAASGGNMINDSSTLQSRSGQLSQPTAISSDTTNSSVGLSSDQATFLDGRFAGGWQSNADIPERRRVIFSILEVIRQMRPDTSKLSNK
jgi:hypothetical protein